MVTLRAVNDEAILVRSEVRGSDLFVVPICRAPRDGRYGALVAAREHEEATVGVSERECGAGGIAEVAAERLERGLRFLATNPLGGVPRA